MLEWIPLLFRQIANLVGKLFPSKTATDDRQTLSNIPVNFPWWVKIYTAKPRCLYYFGPFDSMAEAKENQAGYIEDLEKEGAEGMTVSIEQCKPQELTQEWDS